MQKVTGRKSQVEVSGRRHRLRREVTEAKGRLELGKQVKVTPGGEEAAGRGRGQESHQDKSEQFLFHKPHCLNIKL